jgi:hypothetical protein
MLIEYTKAQKQQKRLALWRHVCDCFQCTPTSRHQEIVDQVVEQLYLKGFSDVLDYHNQQSHGRGLLDPIIPEGYNFCETGLLFLAAYKEWDI